MVVLFVVMADIGAIIVSFYVSGLLADAPGWTAANQESEMPWLMISLIVLMGLQTALGSYRSFRSVSSSQQNRIALRSYVFGVLMIGCILLVEGRTAYAGPQAVLFMILLPALYLLVRWILWQWITHVHPSGIGAMRTVVIGEGTLLHKIVAWLKRVPGYDLVDVITVQAAAQEKGSALERLNLEKRIVDEQLDLLIVSPASMNGSKEYLEQLCRLQNIHVRLIPPEIEILFTQATIDDLMGIPLVLKARHGFPRGRMFLKRAIDLLGAAALTVLLSPLLLLVIIATWLESPGPVIYKQRRCLSGTDKAFDIYKFRSMTVEADQGKTILQNESTGALFKVRRDPRVTRVGRLIRRYSIDELPQLINIFKGEMSLVGPRPLPLEDFARLSEDDAVDAFCNHRSAMKPGLTGLWQISGRSDLGFREMILLDVYYIENHTHLFDLEIMLRTIPAVILARGAY
jgi:exopolysaccharide biosynthesis polyprenyl glycosylphosphotransferase